MTLGNPQSPQKIREILGERNFAPRKSLGQNFLIDGNVLRKIVEAGLVNSGDLVLEIGPGLGALTEALLKQAGTVVAVEYDRGLFSILKERFSDRSNLYLICQDIMETNLPDLLEGFRQSNNLKVIANLPYYITTPLIFKIVETELQWKSLVFLVQKEVAQRICAMPGTKEYGALTVMLNFYGKVEKIGNVPRTVFYPEPEVDSAIVRIVPYHTPEIQSLYPRLSAIVQAAFQQRRKTILNALNNTGFFGSKNELSEFLGRYGIDSKRRGETLSVEEYKKLAEGSTFLKV